MSMQISTLEEQHGSWMSVDRETTGATATVAESSRGASDSRCLGKKNTQGSHQTQREQKDLQRGHGYAGVWDQYRRDSLLGFSSSLVDIPCLPPF